MEQLPLFLFTLIEDITVGGLVTLVILHFLNKAGASKTKFLVGIIFAIAGLVGMCLSLLHLGSPLRMFNVLNGLGSSHLSREVVLFGFFVLFTAGYALAAKFDKDVLARVLGVIAAVLGIGALVATSFCYMLPGVPAWNTMLTPIQFFVAAAAMGATGALALVSQFEKRETAKKFWIIFLVCVVVFAVWRWFFFSNIVLLVYSF